MSDNAFEGQIFNNTVDLLSSTSDDGENVIKFSSNQLASFNFDGFIPTITEEIVASELRPGMKFSLENDSILYQILDIAAPDEDFEEDAIQEYTIFYTDQGNEIQELTFLPDDLLTVTYEQWDEKIIGNNGWLITSEGNAIFSNVAVRGRIEAQEGFLENLDITGQLNVSTDGSIRIGEDPGNTTAGIILDEFGIYAYNSSGGTTFSIDSSTGNVTLTGGLTIGDVENYLDENDYTTQDDLDGYIPDGGAAGDIVTNATTITGGNISTGRIRSSGYNGPVSGGGSFSTVGSQFNLDDGTIVSREFRIDSSGNAIFKGSLDAADGTFSGTVSANNVTAGTLTGSTFRSSTGITSTSGNGVYLDSSGNVRFSTSNGSVLQFNSTGLAFNGNTLKLGSQTSGGILYGSVNFYTTSGVSIGSISSAASNKTWFGLGDGITLGTGSDYFFVPALGNNSVRGRYRGRGFEIYDNNGNIIISFAGGSGGIRATNVPAGLTSHLFVRRDSSTGQLTQTTSNAAGSSIKYKNVTDPSPELTTDWIDDIQIKLFKYHSEIDIYGEGAPERIGVIAEEVSSIPTISKLVEYNIETGEEDGFDYEKLALLLIPEIKKLRERISILESKLGI